MTWHMKKYAKTISGNGRKKTANDSLTRIPYIEEISKKKILFAYFHEV